MSKKVHMYVGWLMANKEDRNKLQEMGVKGQMKWIKNYDSFIDVDTATSGVFSHCECTPEVLDELADNYDAFWHRGFKAYSKRSYKKYAWRTRYEKIFGL